MDFGIALAPPADAWKVVRDAGYRQFTVQLVPGAEDAIEDWARIKAAFD